MTDKAIEKINAGMQKNANDPYAEIIGHYILDRCLDGTAAGLVLKKDKTLSGALGAVMEQARKAKRGNAAVLTPAAVFGAVDRYFGFSHDLAAQWKALNGADPVVSEAVPARPAPALDLRLKDRVDFSEVKAQRLMRLAREYSNPSALTDLGVTKALALLALPESEREEFASETHTVNGAEKTVLEMSTRELEQAIRERDEARLAAEAAQAELKESEKASAASDPDVVEFGACLNGMQDQGNRALGQLTRMVSAGKTEQARRLGNAMQAMAEKVAEAVRRVTGG